LSTLGLMFLGLGLSAVFWLPAILETKYVVGLEIFDIASHFPDLYQLLIPSWGSGFSGAGIQNELSYQIGIANLLALFLSAIVIILQIKKKNKKLSYTLFFFLSSILVLFLMLKTSSFIWKTIPLMNYFQFPWRLLSLETLFASFLAGSIFSLFSKNKLKSVFLAAFLILIAFTSGIGYAKPAYYMYRDDNYYVSKANFINGTNSPGNVFNTIYLKSIPAKEKEEIVFVKGSGKIITNEARSNFYNFTIKTDTDSEIQVNLAYFPGWEVYVDGKKQIVNFSENGRFTFAIPKGENSVKVFFGDTLIRKVSVIISLISLISIVVLLINKRFATIKE